MPIWMAVIFSACYCRALPSHLRYFDAFSGIGGFTLPLNERGHQCVGFSEIDRHAIAVYRSHFPRHICCGNIRALAAETLPRFDLLCGGFPCQAFSIAGHRRGFADTRGALFFDLCRIASAKQPRLLLLENVRGMLSHDGDRTFGTVLASLDELGYDLQWQVLNSKNYGVPQNRERVFIVGHRRGTPRPTVFPLQEGASGGRTPKSRDTNGPRAVAIRGRSGGFKIEIRKDGLCNALRSSEGGSSKAMIEDGGAIRRLTPLECERLQGFPDGWTAGMSDTQRYKCLGNAVTVNVVRAIVRRLE